MVVQLQLLPDDGLAKGGLKQATLPHAFVQRHVKAAERALPLRLGGVKGEIRVAHQFCGTIPVVRRQRDAHACPEVAGLPVEHERPPADRVHDARRERVGRGRLVGAELQDRELVAAQAGNHVAVTQRRAKAVRHHAEDHVSRRVPEHVVDGLEAVQVQHQHRETPAGLPPGRGVQSEKIEEARAVGQAGQRVVERQRPHPRLGPDALALVPNRDDRLDPVPERHLMAQDAHRNSLTGRVDQLDLALFAFGQARNVQARQQQADGAAGERPRSVSGQPLDAVVGGDDDVALADQQAFQGHVGKLAQPAPVPPKAGLRGEVEPPPEHCQRHQGGRHAHDHGRDGLRRDGVGGEGPGRIEAERHRRHAAEVEQRDGQQQQRSRGKAHPAVSACNSHHCRARGGQAQDDGQRDQPQVPGHRALHEVGTLADIVQRRYARAEDQSRDEVERSAAHPDGDGNASPDPGDGRDQRHGRQDGFERRRHAGLERQQDDEVGCPRGAAARDDADKPPAHPSPSGCPCGMAPQRERGIDADGAHEPASHHETRVVSGSQASDDGGPGRNHAAEDTPNRL